MTTIERLQILLSTPIKTIRGYQYKDQTKRIYCVDGAHASIQASETHYCSPQNNIGPYTHVEIWCIDDIGNIPVTQFEYSEDEPSAYVPIEAVAAFLDDHGGIAPWSHKGAFPALL